MDRNGRAVLVTQLAKGGVSIGRGADRFAGFEGEEMPLWGPDLLPLNDKDAPLPALAAFQKVGAVALVGNDNEIKAGFAGRADEVLEGGGIPALVGVDVDGPEVCAKLSHH